MNDSSPRWPGTDVDFGRKNAGETEDTETSPMSPSSPASDAQDPEATAVRPAIDSSELSNETSSTTKVNSNQLDESNEQVSVDDDDPISAATATAFSKPVSPGTSLTTGAGALSAAAVAAPAVDPTPVVEGPEKEPAKRTRYLPRERRTRRARLRLARIDPWSVMKTTFLFAIAFGIITVVVVAVLWTVLAGSGALSSVESMLGTLFGDPDSKNSFALDHYINTQRVLGLTTLLAAIDVVIITAVCTLGAFLYNLAATVLGGLEVTLAED